MSSYVNWLEGLLLLAFAASAFLTILMRRKLEKDLRSRIEDLPGHMSATFLYLEIQYLRHRARIG
ncbi:MAG TPA: hypothetical protein VIU40_05260, partial [Geobacteraceae bacterium]